MKAPYLLSDEVRRMNTFAVTLFTTLHNAMLYMSEGVWRLFSPSEDEYPATGVQPFDGEPYSEWVEFSER
jgi:hypothetical protein